VGGITPSNQSGGGLIVGCVFIGSVNGHEAMSPINCYADGRGGTYAYNYYKEDVDHTTGWADPSTPKNETVLPLADMAEAMNANLEAIAGQYGIGQGDLCSWVTVDGKPMLVAN
jgi:hypothetical protein